MTIEGDPIITDFSCNAKIFKVIQNTTRDPFGRQEILQFYFLGSKSNYHTYFRSSPVQFIFAMHFVQCLECAKNKNSRVILLSINLHFNCTITYCRANWSTEFLCHIHILYYACAEMFSVVTESFSSYKINRAVTTVLIITGICTMVFYLAIFANIYLSDTQRIRSAQLSSAEGKKEIPISELPFKQFMWYTTPQEDIHKKSFKEFYNLSNDSNLIIESKK